jgi:hypothetical protein
MPKIYFTSYSTWVICDPSSGNTLSPFSSIFLSRAWSCHPPNQQQFISEKQQQLNLIHSTCRALEVDALCDLMAVRTMQHQWLRGATTVTPPLASRISRLQSQLSSGPKKVDPEGSICTLLLSLAMSRVVMSVPSFWTRHSVTTWQPSRSRCRHGGRRWNGERSCLQVSWAALSRSWYYSHRGRQRSSPKQPPRASAISDDLMSWWPWARTNKPWDCQWS